MLRNRLGRSGYAQKMVAEHKRQSGFEPRRQIIKPPPRPQITREQKRRIEGRGRE
jgi:hypothetical protein